VDENQTQSAVKPRPLLYVVGPFPVASETFVAREIRGVIDHGLAVNVLAQARRSDEHLEEADRAWASDVMYGPNLLSLRVVAANIITLLRRPGQFVRMWRSLISLKHDRWRYLFRAVSIGLKAPIIANRVAQAGGAAHIHAQFATGQTELAIALGALLSCGYSFTAHARDIYAVPNALPEKIRRARFVVTCSLYNVDYLSRLSPDTEPNHVVRLFYGVDNDRLASVRPQLDSPNGSPLIFTAARLVAKKGFDTLIEACGVLRDRGVDFRCEIGGDGPLCEELAAQVERLKLEDRVQLLGWQSHDALLERYASATCFAQPCRVTGDGDRDGIPNALIEAMGASLPTIATPVSGIPELISDTENGLLVPPDDIEALVGALSRLLTEPELRVSLGNAARKTVSTEFDLKTNASTLAKMCQSMSQNPIAMQGDQS